MHVEQPVDLGRQLPDGLVEGRRDHLRDRLQVEVRMLLENICLVYEKNGRRLVLLEQLVNDNLGIRPSRCCGRFDRLGTPSP
jgi:hypothetical protein